MGTQYQQQRIEECTDVAELVAECEQLLAAANEADAWLSSNKPAAALTAVELRMWRMERAKWVRRKTEAMAAYRERKRELKRLRAELRLATRDVGRDLTDTQELVAALLEAAQQSEAWRNPRHQQTIDAAQRWLGVCHD